MLDASLYSCGPDGLRTKERDRAEVHRIIYDELCHGIVKADSRRVYQRVIEDLKARSAQAVILGCTEITLLIGADDSALPVFDTTALHARAAVDWAIGASTGASIDT
ncbi:aspartate/glutamate racemase family protein [Paraburkholderia sp.]|uniref:aspartate/glutamate racemase family protein n=1 Tax=Paraburkholderia sp. TaxID=1926495 RepID=UPI0025D2D20C|nr:aspartate/glutamate racemase family protein [Paraburkholderia sp.]